MKSKVLEQDHNDLIQLNRSLSPEERLEAFYYHSLLLNQFVLTRKTAHKHYDEDNGPGSVRFTSS